MTGLDLTIVVPTRNESANIARFLASLPETIRLIVVDKSTDGTPELVERLRPFNTTLLHCPGTLTDARQLGAEAALTRWLLFTDADVAFDAAYFARAAELARGANGTRPAARRGSFRSRPRHVLFGPKLSADAYRRYYRSFAAGQRALDLVRIPAASGSNMIVSADAFEAVGGFDTRLTCNEDSELVWRIARARFGWVFDPGLIVWAFDHRRLRRGRLLKTAHTLLRCTALYLDLVPDRYRSRDWGYWSQT